MPLLQFVLHLVDSAGDAFPDHLYWRALAHFTIFMDLDGMLGSYFCYEYKFNDLSNNINFVPQILIFLIYLVKVVFLRKRNDSYLGTKGALPCAFYK